MMMSDSDSSEVLKDMVQHLGLSQFSASLIDLEPISDGSSSVSSLSSDFAHTSKLKGTADFSPSRFSTNSMKTLESQITQRDLVIDSIRQQHREQLDALHEKLRETDNAINFIKKKFEEKISSMNEKFMEEKAEIEAKASAEVKRLKDLNRSHRQNLVFSKLPELTISEYESLSTKPPTDLTLPQFLSVQLYEYNREAKTKFAKLCSSHSEASSTIEKLQSQLNNATAELLTEREMRISLESRLASTTKKIAPKPEKKESPKIHEKLIQVENERAELRGAYQVALARLNEANDQKASAQASNKELEQKLLHMKTENSSLNAQIKALHTLSERQEAMLSQQYNDIAELKRARDDFFNRFVQTSESRRSELGSLLKSEVAKIQERSRNDVEFIRGVSEKMRERELKVLTESQESLQAENKQLRLDLRKAEEDRAKLQAEYQTLQLAHEAELTRISSDLRIKSYELERIKLVHDELKAAHEDTTDDRDALSAKFDILKQEVMRLEHEVKLRDAQIQTLSDKVMMYDKLENELDNAIESLDMNTAGPLAVPSDANRRVKQSVMLARRVMQLTNQNNQLTAECESLKQQLVNNQQEMDDMKKQLENSGQPQQVFVQMLNEKQQEILKLKTRIQSLTEMNQELIKEKESLQHDVKIVSRKNDEIMQVKKFNGCFMCDQDPPTHDVADPSPFIITRHD
ncbi:hypothetical protein TRFO_24194 [Tritrichomonas foetus]|uniref:Uncharacterized protein n=1 Tax=Tritrichomonas foetus TaxID=1144522 RepID=A0A1J4KDB1_9EUKA|nr:hypothetical protein TRFO_24194 [Tritrichomonas foetus]|eukprot:OHT07614.1 hypothetical protein TRFO_24194 [Tritrichomonas foetus]